MARNQQKGLVRIAEITPGTSQASVKTGGVALPSSGAEAAARSSEASFSSIAGQMSGLASQVGAYADHAAQVEGARAGRQAGLDPEFRPTRSITIRGEAYDKAGLDVMRSNIGIEVENDIAEGGDLAKKHEGWTRRVPRELRPEVTHMFRRAELAQSRQNARAEEARIRGEVTEALQGEVDSSVKGLHQRAYAMGLDAVADEMLAKDVALLADTLKRTGPDGEPLVAPKQAAKIIRQAQETVFDARFLGAFDRLESVDAKAAMLEKISEDWQAGKGIAKNYDLRGYQRLTSQLEGELRRAQAGEDAERRVVQAEIKNMDRMVKKGFAPSADQLAGLQARAQTSNDPELQGQLDIVVDAAAWQQGARKWRPEELKAYGSAIREQIKKSGPNDALVGRLDLAKKLEGEARAALKTDPLGWADRVGLIDLSPLDFSQENLSASIGARVAQAETVASAYGIKPNYLRPDEVRRLSVAAAQGGNVMIDMARSISSAAPEQAQAILGQIFDNAPVVAMIGGLVADAGDGPMPAIALDAADGLALKKADPKGFKPLVGSARNVDAAANIVLGGALKNLPRTKNAAIGAANAAYEVRARRAGISEFNESLWKEGFAEAIGQRVVGGKTYGGVFSPGIFSHQDDALVIPTFIKQDDFEDVIAEINDDDLAAVAEGDGPLFGDRPATAGEIRGGQLVSIGNGRYRVAMGDVDTDPQWVGTQSGEPYVLDLNHLAPRLRERLPEAFLGGGENVEQDLTTQSQVDGQLDADAAEELPGVVVE